MEFCYALFLSILDLIEFFLKSHVMPLTLNHKALGEGGIKTLVGSQFFLCVSCFTVTQVYCLLRNLSAPHTFQKE